MGADNPNTDPSPTLGLCCPKCGNSKVVVGMRRGYFWIYECGKCGYRGKEGEGVGCVI